MTAKRRINFSWGSALLLAVQGIMVNPETIHILITKGRFSRCVRECVCVHMCEWSVSVCVCVCACNNNNKIEKEAVNLRIGETWERFLSMKSWEEGEKGYNCISIKSILEIRRKMKH